MNRTVFFLCAVLALAQNVTVNFLSQDVIEDRLRSYTTKNATREPAMKTLFESAGCKDDFLSEEAVKGSKAPNLICTAKGSEASAIVVGAHFDLVEKGNGVVDNWSGASLLPSFYQGLAASGLKHTFILVAFTGEEQGLLGSKSFVKQLGDRKSLIKAMVNLDTLGLGETKIWYTHADHDLANLLAIVGKKLNIPVGVVNVDNVGTTDSESFREKKIPAMTVHSVTQSTLSILHSPKDKIDAIRMDDYYQSYKLLIAYFLALDQKLD